MSEYISCQELSFCPKCGNRSLTFAMGKCWLCSACNFTLFHNVATAVAVILCINGKIVTIIRQKNPSKGMLALPGGFVEPGELAESAAERECYEEIGITPSSLKFIASFPNEYFYKGILYNTCDLFFSGVLNPSENLSGKQIEDCFKLQKEEVSGIYLLDISEIKNAPIAFPSLRKGLITWTEKHYNI